MRILVTGATGFVGSRLCQYLLADGHEVGAFCRSASGSSELDSAVHRYPGDITDPAAVSAAVKGWDVVVHAAAALSDRGGHVAQQMRVNVDGTHNIAVACREHGVRRLVHISSTAAIGIANDPARPADETFRFNLQDSGLTYHLSKWKAEQQIRASVERGLDAVIVNPSSIMSPSHAAQLAASVRRGAIVPCYSGGNCIVHCDDVVAGIMLALERGRPGERYILGGENLSFRALAEKAATTLGMKRKFVSIPEMVTGLCAMLMEPWGRITKRPPRVSYMVHYCANRYQYYDSDKAQRELGYHARDVNATLNEMLHHRYAQ